MSEPNSQMVMIYNAPGGLLYAMRDSFWKTFNPSTYPCALCALAFGFFTMHREWRDFLERQPHQVVELHVDNYREKFSDLTERLPVILLCRADGSHQVIVSASEMEAMTRLGQLVELAERRLNRAQAQV